MSGQGEANGNPLQYSRLGNPMDRGDCGLQSMGSQRVRLNWWLNNNKIESQESQQNKELKIMSDKV